MQHVVKKPGFSINRILQIYVGMCPAFIYIFSNRGAQSQQINIYFLPIFHAV